MIHEILPSDVECAKGMLDASHSDAEVLATLTARGLEPARAAELVDSLRHGRTPSIQLPEGLAGAGHRQDLNARASDPHAQGKPHASHGHSHRGKHKPLGLSWWVVVLALIFVIAFGYVLYEVGRAVTRAGAQQDKHEVSRPPGR